MSEIPLYLVSANKSRIGNMRWSDDDYDVRDGSPNGRVLGRIYKLSHAPTEKWWWWGLTIFPAIAADRGTADTRGAAMTELKAQWTRRRNDPWVL